MLLGSGSTQAVYWIVKRGSLGYRLEDCPEDFRYRLEVWRRSFLLWKCGHMRSPSSAHEDARACSSTSLVRMAPRILGREPSICPFSEPQAEVLDILSLTSLISSSPTTFVSPSSSQTPGEHSAHRHVKGEGILPEAVNDVGALHVLHRTDRVCLMTIELWLCTLVSHDQQRKASSLSQCKEADSPQSAQQCTTSILKNQQMLSCSQDDRWTGHKITVNGLPPAKLLADFCFQPCESRLASHK